MAIYQRLADDDPADARVRSALAKTHKDIGFLLWVMGKPVDAEAEYQRAIVILEKLLHDQPGEPLIRQRLVTSLNYLGGLHRWANRAAEARGVYERAIALNEPTVRSNPTELTNRLQLLWSIRGRGLTLGHQGDATAAAAETRRALAMCDGLPTTGWALVGTACCHAALAGLAGRDRSGISAEEGEAEATRAMELLRRAFTVGYRHFHAIRIETALDPLRKRDDFKKLMAELEKAPPPQHEKK